MIRLIASAIKKQTKTLVIYLSLSTVFNWMYVAIYPSFSQEAEKMNEVFANYPPEIFKAMGINLSTILSNLEGFLSTENFSLIWPLIVITLAINLGVNLISREIEQGTIELLLAQPLSRTQIYFAKFIAYFCIITIFNLISIFSLPLLASLYQINFQIQSYFYIFVLGTLFAWTIFGLTSLFSAISDQTKLVSGGLSAILFLMYSLNAIANLNQSLEKLKYLSIFYYFDHNTALINQQISLKSIIVLFSLGLMGTLLGNIIFRKKDITV